MTFGRRIQEARERRAAEKQANLAVLCTPSRSLHRPTYSGGTAGPAPKTEEHRNQALLAMAKDRPCLLMVPAVCNHRQGTTVACHSNLSIHGKAGARKADDQYTVWGCAACHFWLDFGKAASAQKEMAFQLAHARQVLAWRLVARDRQEPMAARRAAQWALDLLNATPLVEDGSTA
jgi:hypothetical protein